MRIVELSDHPASLLRRERQRRSAQADAERRRFEAALARHRGRLDLAARARDRARAEHRWWAWLTGSLAVRRERRLTPTAPPPPQPPSDQEAIITAGIEGEQRAELGLGTKLGDEWVLLRGYRNNRGEIDHLLLGPRGLFAIEGKHRNATVYCDGDQVTIDVANPDLAVARVGVEMDLVHDARAYGADALDRLVETSGFEPQGHTVSDGLAGIADRAVVMPDLKPVQLHDQPPVDVQLLVLGAAVTAGGAEYLLVPPARRLDIDHGDHGLRPHGRDSLVRHETRD